MSKRIITGLVSVFMVIFLVVFPIVVFKVIPPTEQIRFIVLSSITLVVVISGLLHLNIGILQTAILLSYNQQKQVIKQHPILLNILYGIIIINFVILLKYVVFMSFLIEPTVFWKIVLLTIFMII
jgi:hypothetical protein